ncbi:MAG: family 10 glycosylhydrolase [Verrucomicrobia bacterium]|nr:family 10 glycosylhydrolase [Verrucomicrobiota bacterium]
MQPHCLIKRSCVILLALTFWLVPFKSAAQTDEFRGVWVDAWGAGFLDASQVTTLVNRCRTYNFNAVVVQMRRRGDAFYMPQAPNLEPRTTALSASYDALQEIINQCHNSNPRIEVHCWVPTFLVGSSGSTNNMKHVMNVRPDLMMKNSVGQTFIGEGYYLDPGNPDAQTWNHTMAKDIVSRYNIDGFHWDYVRYPAADSGYNDLAIARYNAEFGFTGQPTSSDPQFSAWRRRQVTEFMRWVNADLLELKPNLIISASVFSSRTDAFDNRFQDWAAWNNEGSLDICMPMTYTADNATFNSRATDAFNNQGVRRVYVGPGAYLNTKENTVTQLNYVRTKPFKGSVLYSYRTPNSGTVNQTATFTHIRDNYQPTWVPTPALPWKTNPTKGIIKGTITLEGSTNAVYNATVTLTGTSSRTQKTEGHGKYAFFETTPGTYMVTVSYPGVDSVSSNSVSLAAGQIRTVNLTLTTNDTTGPVLSGIQIKSLTDRTATVSWNTDEPADSLVEYGTTLAYGSTISNTTLELARDIHLTGLNPNTTYNYRVKSKDASNNQTTSANGTFKTNPSGVVNDVIVESRQTDGTLTSSPLYADSGFANSNLKSSAVPLSGSSVQGSRYASSGTPSFTVIPTLPVAGGTYDVYLSHGLAGSVSEDIIVSVAQTGCSGLPSTTTIFQKPGANTWELLGRMNLTSGNNSPSLTFTRSSGVLSGSARMYADAIKFVHITTIPVINTHPQSQTAIGGSSVTFTVGATGASLVYQWHKNNIIIPGATASSYTKSNIQVTDEGSFHATVNNSAGTATSSSANLLVRFLLNSTAMTGGVISRTPNQPNYVLDAEVALTANPEVGFTFSGWSGDVTGTNNPATIVMSDNRNIIANFVSSVPDQIVDNPAAVFTGTWTTATGAGQYGANFSHAGVTTSGTPSATATFRPNLPTTGKYDIYVWYPSAPSDRSTNAQYIVFHSGGTVTVPVNQLANTGSWRFLTGGIQFVAGTNGSVRLQNNTGETGRRVVADAVRWSYSGQNSGPVLISPPQSVAVRHGDEAAFNVVASGSAPFTYQWKFQNTNIAGATANILSLSDVQNDKIGSYTVAVSNSYGGVTSSAATLGLIPPSEPVLHSIEILPNQSLRFVMEGEPGYSYSIDVSTNLIQWTTLTNLLNESGSVEFIDPDSSNQARRFYRSRWNQ